MPAGSGPRKSTLMSRPGDKHTNRGWLSTPKPKPNPRLELKRRITAAQNKYLETPGNTRARLFDYIKVIGLNEFLKRYENKN